MDKLATLGALGSLEQEMNAAGRTQDVEALREAIDAVEQVKKHRMKVTYETITPELIRAELAEYEQRYGMTSSEFLRRFYAGELDDHDIMPWEFTCDMAKKFGIELS